MPLYLNGTTGVSGVDGTTSSPALQGNDTNTGIVFGTDTISLVEGGTAALSIDSSANASLVGTLAMGSSFLRNRIINGDMRIDQRNNGASVTNGASTGDYTLDRWRLFGSAASKFTVQQNAGSVTPPAGFTNYLGVTSLSAYTVGASEIFAIQQFIEGYNVADMAFGTANAQTFTISFWVRSSLTGTFGGAVNNNTQVRSYPFTYSISAANTWERKTITIAGDTSGTWLTTSGRGLELWFGLGVGSSVSGPAGAWATAGYYSATGATSVVGTNGATFYITGVQLEVGSVATPFERRQYGTELMLCYRYAFQTSGEYLGQTYGSTQAGVIYPFPVVMRASPATTLVTNGSLVTPGGGTSAITSIAASSNNPYTGRNNYNVASGLGAAASTTFTTATVVLFSAEL